MLKALDVFYAFTNSPLKRAVVLLFILIVFSQVEVFAGDLYPPQPTRLNCFGATHVLHHYGKYKAVPLQYETTFSRVGGYQIEGEGPTVIALHGFSGDANYMMEFGRLRLE